MNIAWRSLNIHKALRKDLHITKSHACSNNSNVHHNVQLSDLLQSIGLLCASFLNMNKLFNCLEWPGGDCAPVRLADPQLIWLNANLDHSSMDYHSKWIIQWLSCKCSSVLKWQSFLPDLESLDKCCVEDVPLLLSSVDKSSLIYKSSFQRN